MTRRHPEGARELVDRLYAALASGDPAVLSALLAPDFRADLSPGLPNGWGEHPYESAQAMIRDGWGRIAAAFEVRAEPDVVLVQDDAVAVLGSYRGRARAHGAPLEAPFAHLWHVSDSRFVSLRQVTDTAAWRHAAVASAR